jgi:hypothetical protein
MGHLSVPPGIPSDECGCHRRAKLLHPQRRSGGNAQLIIKRSSEVLEMRFAGRIGVKPDISKLMHT